VLDETGIDRLRLGSLEPWGVRAPLVDLLRDDPRLLPMLHLPLQSGSERILRAMRRPITARGYLQVAARLFTARPDLALYLDVMVGFPGETDRDFDDTLAVLGDLAWTKLHVFPFSARRGTPAAALEGAVPPEVKRERARRLIDLSDERFRRRLAARVGSADEVLMERGGSGHTRDHFPCRVPTAIPGELLRVKLHGTSPDGCLLEGARAEAAAAVG
jgi:threonylcarbamoyladenosine tRNA methylthiotransferase MtaB